MTSRSTCAPKTHLKTPGGRKNQTERSKGGEGQSETSWWALADVLAVYDESTYESHGSVVGFPSVINTWQHWQEDCYTCINNDTESTAQSKMPPHIILCSLCARRRHSWMTAAGVQLSWVRSTDNIRNCANFDFWWDTIRGLSFTPSFGIIYWPIETETGAHSNKRQTKRVWLQFDLDVVALKCCSERREQPLPLVSPYFSSVYMLYTLKAIWHKCS